MLCYYITYCTSAFCWSGGLSEIEHGPFNGNKKMNLFGANPREPATGPSTAESEICLLTGARMALFRWAEIISSGDVEDILGLYAPDAILVPTLSNEIRAGEDERRNYFEFFLANGTPICRIGRHNCRISHKLGTVVIGGLYTFHFQRGDGEVTVPARFLFTFEEMDGRWLITGHHSSRLT